MKFKNVVFLGRSGAGKGTQLKLLEAHLNDQGKKTLYISIGELLRALAKKDTFAGRKIKSIITEGKLIDEWVAAYLWQNDIMTRLLENDTFLFFDGSPRKLREAEALDATLEWFERDKEMVAILLDVGHEEVFGRLKARGRDDDTDHGIKSRLDWFETEVVPVVRYYESSGRLISINGEGTIEEVQTRIREALGVE